MSGRWVIGDRIATGTNNLSGQLSTWLACRELDGKKVKGPERGKAILARASGGLAVAWFLGGIMYALGVVWEGPLVLWVLSSLVASSPPKPAAPAAARVSRTSPALALQREALLFVLAEITADRSGIHLLRLFERMRSYPAYAGQDDKTLRTLLATHDIPVHRSVTADKVSGRSGIKAADIAGLLTPPPPDAAPLDDRESVYDQDESRSLSPLSDARKGVTTP